jgi:hypothetical protein
MRYLALLFIATLACSDGTGPVPVCSRSVDDLHISAGTTPTFTWTPACRLGSLGVIRVSDQTVVWYVRADGPALRPPVQYGVTPRGLEVLAGPAPLVPGAEYRVSIAVAGSGQAPVPVLGIATFVP